MSKYYSDNDEDVEKIKNSYLKLNNAYNFDLYNNEFENLFGTVIKCDKCGLRIFSHEYNIHNNSYHRKKGPCCVIL